MRTFVSFMMLREGLQSTELLRKNPRYSHFLYASFFLKKKTLNYNMVIFHIFQYKLCKVKRVCVGPKGVPFLVTNDSRTIRYPDPLIKVHDTVQVDIATGKIIDSIKFDSGKISNYKMLSILSP